LVPKGRTGFRIATQLDPFDAILFTALVIECGPSIEAKRVPVSDGIVHSHRFALGPNGQIYSPASGYETFRTASLSRARGTNIRYVVVTDISDFYSHLYHHPLENALTDAVGDDYRKAIMRFLNQWNMKASHGIPIGPAASRILADLTIADIDFALRAERIQFCRYSDDYRLFTETEREAYEALTFLATTLYQSHGLTLQMAKTEVLEASEYIGRFTVTEEDIAANRLGDSLVEILAELAEPYEPLDPDSLDPEVLAEIEELNLWGIIEGELNSDVPKLRLIRFALWELERLQTPEPHPILIPKIRTLYPVFKHVIRTLAAQSGLDADEKEELGSKLLTLIDHELLGHLEYHRSWVLDPFVQSPEWANQEKLLEIYQNHSDPLTRRGVVLALGEQGAGLWFRARKAEIFGLNPWERRALIVGARSLPGDESDHWYRSIRPRLDDLEKAVLDYAKSL
jgi:hypothetical protein